jgi:hypothetical protein
LSRYAKEPRPEERILYGRPRGRVPFEEAVQQAEAELRAEAEQLETHCPPSYGQLSQQPSAQSQPSSGNSSNQEAATSISEGVEEMLEGYEDDFDQESEIRTQLSQ